ncbi:DinB family protein [Pedobacter sp. GR22-6]|uniref:DinB family protein n=1 Tax=Pedobacter sp. GR22-6 TaxID=3127957 RepID=UPI00307D01A5
MNHSKILTNAAFVAELHDRVELHLQQAILIYQNSSEEQLNKPAEKGGWSIAQCLEHLNSYGSFYLPLFARALKDNRGRPVGQVKRGWLGDYLIKMMDPDRKAVQYKALKKHLPAPKLDAYKTVAKFIEQQEQLIQLLAAAGSADLNGIRIPTSISPIIRLRLGEAFAFLIIHNERHIRQANRNLGQPEKQFIASSGVANLPGNTSELTTIAE